MSGWLLRIVLALLLAASGWRVFHQLVAVQAARILPGKEGLEEAIRWDPTGADYYLQLGRYHLEQLDPAESERARPMFEKAAELNPYEPGSRQELALLYEVEGRRDEAERLLLEAVALRPTRGQMHWLLGNFYLRSGDLQKALPALRRAMEAEPGLVRPAATLLLGIGVDATEVEHLVPSGSRSRRQLLDVLSERLDGERSGSVLFTTLGVWREELAKGALSVSQGAFLINRLLRAGLPELARREWAALNSANGRHDLDFESGANAIWNSSFVHSVEGGDLDWLLPSTGTYAASRSQRGGVGDSAALQVDFRGEVPGGQRRVEQRVVVEPGGEYRLSAVVRVEGFGNLPTPRLEVLDGSAASHLAESPRFQTDPDWHQVEARFTVPASTAVIIVRLTDTIRSEVRGRVWIDSISLRPTR